MVARSFLDRRFAHLLVAALLTQGCDWWAAQKTRERNEPLYSQRVRPLSLESATTRVAVERTMAAVDRRVPVSVCSNLLDHRVSLSTGGDERVDKFLGRIATAAGATRITYSVAMDPGSIGRPWVTLWCAPEEGLRPHILGVDGRWLDYSK